MRLKKFRVKNYRSIIDSGDIEISENDNVFVLAGQNESGKSSLLRALYDYERESFDLDTVPFSIEEKKPLQMVSCTYAFEPSDNVAEILTSAIKDLVLKGIGPNEKILDESKIQKIKEFTLTKTKNGDSFVVTIDDISFKIFQSAILDKPKSTEKPVKDEGVAAAQPQPSEESLSKPAEKYLEVTEEKNSKVANLFWEYTPVMIFFDDFCDLLPDKIFVSALNEDKSATKGYQAVRNLEKILKIDLAKKDKEPDSVRTVKQEEDNKGLSVTFREDWGQKVHGENKVVVKYTFEKRDGEGENGSYVNFYVETKEKQLLSPKQRSKGLIWFLSLWLELKAQGSESGNLVILLDEPDQHLHVKAQRDILNLINKLSGSTRGSDEEGKQIFYATHSPYLIEPERLNRVNLVVNDKKDGTKVESILSSKFDSEHKRDALLPIAQAIGLGAGGFLAPNKPNVILEGISDYYYFSAMKEILGREGDYAFVPGVGLRPINSLISMSIGYGLQWVVVIDDDSKNSGKESKETFDEIKNCLFDGDEAEARKKIHVLAGSAGIENMFTRGDLSPIGGLGNFEDMVKAVGKKRKTIFAKEFFERVKNKKVKEKDLSKKAKDGFAAVFDFIEGAFSQNKP